jgi:uncharacterized protein YehS (DUF1456 family)
MTNNSIFRRLRYIYDFSDQQMIEVFAMGGKAVSKSQMNNWFRKETDPQFVDLTDEQLAAFLNGFIVLKRGKREGPQPIPEKQLSNNAIFRKMRIALNLIDEDILRILELADMHMSKHELSAFFRNPSQRQYVECNNQVLRNFFQGLEKQKGKQ